MAKHLHLTCEDGAAYPMAQGEFLWCDLATFDVAKTLAHYRDLFDWELKPEVFPDGSTYYYASSSNEVTAGIYEMPEVYRSDEMPSFWMSYIGVDDIVESCELVEKLGGSVVLGPASFGRDAAIAMIEDPFGARFTFFTGAHLQPRSSKMIAGGHYWNELYTPNPEGAAEFYGALLGWKCGKPDSTGRYRVNNLAGSLTTAFQDNTKSQFPLSEAQWTVSFAVADLDHFVEGLSPLDRDRMLWVRSKKGAAVCVTDPNGAVFLVSQVIEESSWFF